MREWALEKWTVSEEEIWKCRRGKEEEEDPFWAESYDGRFGTVVFGHQAFGEAKFFNHAVGIDTGCVYGNKLSAIIFENETMAPSVISVNSKKIYMKPDISLEL